VTAPPPFVPPGRLQSHGILAAAPQPAEICTEFGRKRRLDVDSLVRERVVERQPPCVEELTAEGLVRNAVDRVSHHGQVDGGQVDADLMRPPGLEPHVQQRMASNELGDLEMGDGLARRVRVERLPGRIVPVTADRRLDLPTPRARPAPNERDVVALERTAPYELLETLVRFVRARDDKEAGGVAVEPMDDSGPVLLPAPGLSDQAVDERPGPMARARMHDDPGRLVDDEEMLVLVGDAEVDLLALQRLGLLRRKLELELLPTLQSVALRSSAPVYPDRAGRQQPFGCRARADLRELGEEPVEAVARRLLRNPGAERLEPAAAAAVCVAGAVVLRGGRGRRGR
jgi:hypothetical protein